MDNVKHKYQKIVDISAPLLSDLGQNQVTDRCICSVFFSLFCNILASKAEKSGKSLKRLLYCVQPTVLLQPAAYYLDVYETSDDLPSIVSGRP